MWSWSTNVTDRRTDRRHAISIPRFALWCIARYLWQMSSNRTQSGATGSLDRCRPLCYVLPRCRRDGRGVTGQWHQIPNADTQKYLFLHGCTAKWTNQLTAAVPWWISRRFLCGALPALRGRIVHCIPSVRLTALSFPSRLVFKNGRSWKVQTRGVQCAQLTPTRCHANAGTTARCAQ